jgi:ATP/maltotriose-dependent transcriptional regulator MalT
VAWVRVDPGDHQPAQFWAHVLAALRGAEVVPPDGPLAGLSPQVEIGDCHVRPLLGQEVVA